MNTSTTTMQLPKNVQVTDVVTRDGFQNEDRIVSTQDKLRVIDGLVRAGVKIADSSGAATFEQDKNI